MTAPQMTCPKCGSAMNHQADKLVYPITKEEAVAMSAAFDGVLVQVFACPSCGWIESQRASDSSA